MSCHRLAIAAAMLLVLPASVGAAPLAESKLVSVFPLVTRGAIDENDKSAFEDLVRDEAGEELGNAGFKVLLNETQIKVLEENGVDRDALAKACESACPLEAAKELKVRLFVSGVIVRGSDGSLSANVRLFDGLDGTLVASDE